MSILHRSVIGTCAIVLAASFALAQPPPASQPGRGQRGGRGGPQGPQVVSPEVSSDRHVTFRLLAPNAESARVSGGDIPGIGQGAMTKGENGIWELKVGPLPAGAYRYTFNVNGLSIV